MLFDAIKHGGFVTFSPKQARRHKAEHQIRTIYLKQDQFLPCDRIHLFDTVEEHLRLSTTRLLTNWTNTYQPLFLDSIKQARKNSMSGVLPTTTYFTTPTLGEILDDNNILLLKNLEIGSLPLPEIAYSSYQADLTPSCRRKTDFFELL
jgi:hypothetical protein